MALLASIVGVSVHHVMVTGKQRAAVAQIANFRAAVDTFYTETGHYPTNDEGLAVLTQTSTKVPTPLLPAVPLDPWDHPYEYLCPGVTQPYAIVSRGADGRRDGTGADADISSEDTRTAGGK